MTDDTEPPASEPAQIDGIDCSRRTLLLGAAAAGVAGSGIVGTGSAATVGNGGYHDGPPPGAPTHDYGRHTTANFGDRPVPTNDWYSAIGLEGITGDDVVLAAHPLLYRTQEAGLEVGHPTDWTTSWDDGEEVGDAVMDDVVDLTVSHAASGGYDDVALDDHGDWSASAVFGEGSGAELRVTAAQGSPFVYCEAAGGVEVAFDGPVDVWAAGGGVVGLTVHGNDYGLYAPGDATWDGVGSATLSTDAAYCSIAILPDDGWLDTYEDYAHNVVRDTRFEWRYDESDATVTTTFDYEVEERSDGGAAGTVAALFPHQWKYAAEPTLDATYPSARGEMRVLTGESFSVTYEWRGLLPFLPDEGGYDRGRLEGLLAEVDASIQGGVDQDTYRFGKDAASRLAKCAAVADQVGADDVRADLLASVRDGLEEWFTPSDTATFYHDDSIGVLQGVQSSHGSVTDVSDHHFHFGHYVWAAARVARHDPEWAASEEWGGMVEELIADYANPDRDAGRYPFNRNYSVYEGHSWAHGSGSFGLGNNQESSSEAMMAYAALIEWGAYTGDDELRDFGIALYAMQARAIQEYWFDRDRENFPDDWEADAAGIVWGNGVAHSTWWTTDSEAVYGINVLPLSGYSLHLGWDDALAERTFDQVAALKDDRFDYWPDVLWMYRAFSDSGDAIDRFESRFDSYDAEDAQERAHTLYWLYNLDELGSPDTAVTADTPLYTAFSDGAERTYVAYNADDAGTTVTFSDGTELWVPANSMATSTGDDRDDGNDSDNDDTDDGDSDDGNTDSGGSDGEYSGSAGDGWSATVDQVGTDEYEWRFEPTDDAEWADVQFAEPGTDGWVGYRMSDDGSAHVHVRDAASDGSAIDVRFVWDDGAGGQYVSDRRTHEYGTASSPSSTEAQIRSLLRRLAYGE